MADWDITSPSDTSVVSAFPANERAARAAAKTNFGVDHEDDNADPNVGRHNLVTLVAGDTPTPIAGAIRMFSRDVDDVAELYLLDENDNEIRLTRNGQFNISLTQTSLDIQTLEAEEGITSPVVRKASAGVTVAGGNVTFNLDVATVFVLELTGNATATFAAEDATKVYEFTVIVTTTGSFTFTDLIMTGVTRYKRSGLARLLQPSGRTIVSCIYDGASGTLDVSPVEMEAV